MEICGINALISGGLSSNSYVIGDCIVDPGVGKKDYCIGAGEVKLILLTHAHYDHSTNAALFKNAKILIHEKDAEMLASGKGTYGNAKITAEPLPKKIKLEDRTLEVIHTPGHTKGSCCFFDRKNRILISGDTIFADDIGRTDLHGGNADELRKSIEKVSKLKFSHLLPGHGPLGDYESAKQALEFVKCL